MKEHMKEEDNGAIKHSAAVGAITLERQFEGNDAQLDIKDLVGGGKSGCNVYNSMLRNYKCKSLEGLMFVTQSR